MTSSIFSAAQSGLQAAQAGLLVTSQNIAGANVEGFSRRNASVVVNGFAPNSNLMTGTSFSVEAFTRYYSQLLEAQRRSQQSKTAYSQTLVQATEMLDALMADQANSLAVAISEFFNAAGNLKSDPTSVAYQANFQEKSHIVAQRIVSTAETLDVLESNAEIALKGKLDEVNDLVSRLAAVNVKILEGTSAGNFTPSADYLDERDRLLIEIQKRVGGQSLINGDGTASHFLEGTPLVERGLASRLSTSSFTATSDSIGIFLGTGATTTLPTSAINLGEAGAYIELLGDFLPALSRKLDSLAIGLTYFVNSESGAAGPVFGFTASPSNITDPSSPPLDDLGSPADVAAIETYLEDNSTSALATNATSRNFISISIIDWSAFTASMASDLEDLRANFSEPIQDLVSTVGTQIASWVSEDNANQSIQNVLNDRREAVSGVNLDEEAANMVKFQQLYAASSKLIQTANQLFETLLAMMART